MSSVKPTIFIHTNAQQLLGAKVSAYSLERASSNFDKFNIEILELEKVPHLRNRDGQKFLRGGEAVVWHYAELQSFTPLRLLPPQLMDYQSRSIVIDPDIFAVADPYELLSRDMEGKAIMTRLSKNERSYASSCMLMDNEKLAHWKWNEQLDEMFAMKRDYQTWIALKDQDPETIGILEKSWNDFDNLDCQTKMLHNTQRVTQPWRTGLEYRDMHTVTKRGRERRGGDLKSKLRLLFGSKTSGKHLPHPDRKQQDFFFGLLRECLEKNRISQEELKTEIERRTLRTDAFKVLDATPLLDETLEKIRSTPATNMTSGIKATTVIPATPQAA